MISGCSRFQISGGSPNSSPFCMSIVPMAPSATTVAPLPTSSCQLAMVGALCPDRSPGALGVDRRAPPARGGDDHVQPEQHRALESVGLAVGHDEDHEQDADGEGAEEQRADDQR